MDNSVVSRHIRCDDRAELLSFNRFDFGDKDCFFEVNIEDAYCNGDYMGIKGRFKRAWKAFWAKPVYYNGICVSDKNRLIAFLKDCLQLATEDGCIAETDANSIL